MITALLGRTWGYLATAGAAIGAVLWLWLSAKAAGRREAERDALGKDLENRNVRSEVDRDVARRPEPGADLLRDWRRD